MLPFVGWSYISVQDACSLISEVLGPPVPPPVPSEASSLDTGHPGVKFQTCKFDMPSSPRGGSCRGCWCYRI